MSRIVTQLDIDEADDLVDTGDELIDADDEFDAAAEDVSSIDASRASSASRSYRSIPWSAVVVYGLLPALALSLAVAAGYLRFLDSADRAAVQARIETVQVATDGAVALLSYDAMSVEAQLVAARERLTGPFRDDYTALTHDVVIPGSQEKDISSVVAVPAASSVSATADHAVVLVFVNQTITIGADPPTSSTSCVRVVLDRVDGAWLISAFDPV